MPQALEISCSSKFTEWLSEQNLSLAFTTYQVGKIFFIGLQQEGHLSVFERSFDRAMGLWASGSTLIMSSLYQIWQFENALKTSEVYKGYDCLYVPQISYVTGDLHIHDLALDGDRHLVFRQLMIFDSNNPTGEDFDLRTPNERRFGPGISTESEDLLADNLLGNVTRLNNILILSKDGNSSDPDDDADGGTMIVSFDNPTSVTSIKLVDIDLNETTGQIRVFTSSSDSHPEQILPIPAVGDNSVQDINIFGKDVVQLEIEFAGSGGLAEIALNDII